MKIKVTYSTTQPELHEQLEDEMAKVLQEEIDAEIMRDLFKETGWYEVVLQPMTMEQGCEIDDWVEINIKQPEWHHGLVWMFKDEKEAMWFKLRWLAT